MPREFIVAIDNGVSGSVTVLEGTKCIIYAAVPVNNELNYTKDKQSINRIDTVKLKELLKDVPADKSLVLLERPMINPTRFKASISASRALEATLIVIESLKLPYRYVDSKEWQRVMLPGNTASDELKSVSKQIGKRLFPEVKTGKDADSLLMAEWARRSNL